MRRFAVVLRSLLCPICTEVSTTCPPLCLPWCDMGHRSLKGVHSSTISPTAWARKTSLVSRCVEPPRTGIRRERQTVPRQSRTGKAVQASRSAIESRGTMAPSEHPIVATTGALPLALATTEHSEIGLLANTLGGRFSSTNRRGTVNQFEGPVGN